MPSPRAARLMTAESSEHTESFALDATAALSSRMECARLAARMASPNASTASRGWEASSRATAQLFSSAAARRW